MVRHLMIEKNDYLIILVSCESLLKINVREKNKEWIDSRRDRKIRCVYPVSSS